MAHFLRPLVMEPQGSWALLVADTPCVVARRLVAAFDPAARNRGLLGRDGLPPGTALALAPCSAVHTFFMRFALDILFVARSGEVLKIRRNVQPWRLAGAFRSFAVIECAAGSLPGSARIGTRLAVVASEKVSAGNSSN